MRRGAIRVPISSLLTFGVVGLVLAAVAIALALGFSSAVKNTRTLLADKARAYIDSVTQRVERELAPLPHQARWIAAQIESGLVNPSDKKAFKDFLQTTMAATPQIRGIGFFFTDGRMLRISRDSQIKDIQSPSENPWAGAMMADMRKLPAADLYKWLGPIWIADFQQTAIVHQTPISQKGVLQGVLFQTVTVSDLSRSLAELGDRSGVTPFILYGHNRILVHPLMIDWKPTGLTNDANIIKEQQCCDELDLLPRLGQIDDPVLMEIWGDSRRLPIVTDADDISGSRVIPPGGAEHVIVFRDIDDYGSVPWTVGVHIGVDVVGREMKELFFHAAMGVVILLIAGFIAWRVSRALSRPVEAMALAAAKVRADNLEDVPILRPSNIRELDQARLAFNAMVSDMRERKVIREVFGRYMPSAVGTMLLRQQGRLEPETSRATILFVDIADFTRLSESLQPSEIVETLNAYFSEVVAIIERHGGVITQFQGDAVLAIFNVPVKAADHAVQALNSALEIQKEVDAKLFAGRRLSCRIGINTGEVVAGSVGARGRLTYTVHGNAVNVAARLEQMNKEFGTRILVSATTVSEARGVDTIRIGEMTLRGKSESVEIFTIANGNRPHTAETAERRTSVD